MDVLKDKKTKAYEYVSRYAGDFYYYHILDDKYIYGLSKQLNDDKTQHQIHTITPTDTLDSLAKYYYGRPDLFWLIADMNHIYDVFIDLNSLPYKVLKIPILSSLNYDRLRG